MSTQLADTPTIRPRFRGFCSLSERHPRCYTRCVLRRSWLASILFACACAAPTLPLPPPTALVEDPPDAMGLATVRGEARPGAFVGCLNNRTEAGVIVRADVDDGAYELRIPAEGEDLLTLWQFDSTAPGGEQIDVI